LTLKSACGIITQVPVEDEIAAARKKIGRERKLPRLMTLKEIAKQLEVPESSLRKYREIFSSFVPSVGAGRARRYRTEAIEILKDIRDMREDLHMPWDAITDQLAKKYPIDATPAGPAPAARPAQTPLSLQIEPQAAAVEADPQQAVAQIGGQYLKRMMAISEKQTMIVNAMAIEMMRAADQVRKEARADYDRLQKNMTDVIGALSKSLGAVSQQERALLREIQKQIGNMEQSLQKLAGEHDDTIGVVQLQEQLKIVRTKVEQRDKVVQEYKKSFDVLKKENSELREFKQRHIDKAEDIVREVKAMKSSSVMQRLFKFKS
jgi:DNA-binding transcriptional MerR regulator